MKKLSTHQIVFWVCLITSIGLSIAGFCLPPQGIIDGSVLTVIGELLGFSTIAQLPVLMSKDNFSIKHGDTELSVGSNTTRNNDFNE